MLNKSKRILALTLCILLVMLSLAACRRADGDGDTSSTGDVSAVQPGGNEMGGAADGVIDLDNIEDASGGSTTQGDKDGGTTNQATGTKKPTTGVDDDTIDLGKGTATTTTTAKPDNNSNSNGNGNGDQGGNNTTTSTSAPAVAKDPQLDNNDNWVKNPNPV